MPHRLIRHSVPLLALAAVTALAGCASERSRSGFLEPYRFAIPQGNYINQQMLDEVRLRIGTPLLADVFHPNRWEYVFRFQYPNGDAELRRVTVFFADGRVSDIKHDRLPERDDPNDPALPGYQPTERHVNS